jgi:hypothetical protein
MINSVVSDDVIIHQTENLSQLPKEGRIGAKGNELSASKDTIKEYNFINSWGSEGDGNVDSSTGNVYIADIFNHRIQVFAPAT